MSAHEAESFASLFKKYRLRSEVDTLSEFGDLLAGVGYVYETSLFSHWQKNERVPRDRRLVIEIIKIFASRGGIRTAEEANSLLASLNMRDLKNDELNFKNEVTDHICDSTHGRLLDWEKLKSSFRSKYAIWIISFYSVLSMWYFIAWIFHRLNSFDARVVGYTYSLPSFTAMLYFTGRLKKYPNHPIAKSIQFFTYGLFAQWIGLIVWMVYNMLGVPVPYPSLADIGYFLLIPCYIIAVICFIEGRGQKYTRYILKREALYFLLPITTLLVCYSILMHITGYDFLRQIKLFLGISFPFGELLPILLVMYVLYVKTEHDNFINKIVYMALLIALSIQFLAEYSFLYEAQIGRYVDGGFVDYLYMSAYIAMNLVLIALLRILEENY